MSARTPTPEQAAAIKAEGRDVLVEAGAGSGKTGVMVDRYCRLVCEKGFSPDEVLAFTFTEKAAAELRQRIRDELTRRAAEGSDHARLLLGQVGGAWITTIHAFCNRLLAGHPVAAGIDPRFRVLDAPEAKRTASEAFDDSLEAFLADGNDARERTAAAFSIAALRGMVIGIHTELRSRGMIEPRLPEPPDPDVSDSVRRAAEAAAEALEGLKPATANWELVQQALRVLHRPARLPDMDALVELRTESSAKAMVPYREAIEVALAHTAEAGEGGVAYRHVRELLAIFDRRFAAAKERRGGIDFEDLQLLAARLLERGEIGSTYRRRFSHVMVDEFQDTNRLQLRLIQALREPDSELMVVGDELQAIYGFRHADLDVFREQRAQIAASREAEAMALNGNFRSRPEVIGAINAIGARLLGEAFVPLLVGTAPERPAGHDGAAVDLLLTARDGWNEEGIDLDPATDASTPAGNLAEARFVAARLRELADTGVQRGQMVVLLRAFTHLDAYEDSLERAGLRPYVVGGRGYWSQQQVGDVCALLATIANPLDDQELFGALASPACGVSPGTLWLLRSAAGKGRHIWPAVERVAGTGGKGLSDPEQLEKIEEGQLQLLRDFAATITGLRERAPRVPLADLVDAVVTETGYDLAVLVRPAGEARLANVRKLMSLATEFEASEGRDLRGLLDFIASRAEADADGQAATAAESHDGVRIMTVHNAKGLEFDVVVVPDLSRRLLAGSRVSLLAIGPEDEEPRVGMQLRRLGAASVNLYSHRELRDEAQEADAEEELRLFHVAATRAREHLILSGVVKPQSGGETKPGTPVIERIADAFEVGRESDSRIAVAPPLPRRGLDATFQPSEIEVRVNLPSPEQATRLVARQQDTSTAADLGRGPAPLARTEAPAVPNRPLSYTALAAYDDCAYRFYMERVLGLGSDRSQAAEEPWGGSTREERAARGSAVHALLEWSQANGWLAPSKDLTRDHLKAVGLDPGDDPLLEGVLAQVNSWLASDFLIERVGEVGVRAEVPILLSAAGTVLRGSIDLLVEREGATPLVLDYKTDRLEDSSVVAHSGRYETQRAIYALAVAESRRAPEVEVAYVFLERPDEPDVHRYDGDRLEASRERLVAAIERIGRAEFRPAAVEDRNWELCRGCPAVRRTCSGPRQAAQQGSLTA